MREGTGSSRRLLDLIAITKFWLARLSNMVTRRERRRYRKKSISSAGCPFTITLSQSNPWNAFQLRITIFSWSTALMALSRGLWKNRKRSLKSKSLISFISSWWATKCFGMLKFCIRISSLKTSSLKTISSSSPILGSQSFTKASSMGIFVRALSPIWLLRSWCRKIIMLALRVIFTLWE